MKTYTAQGTCSRTLEYEVTDGVLSACRVVGGCHGNTAGVAKLAVGRKVEDVIALLKGIPCRNGALHRLSFIVLDGHLRHCVRDGIEKGNADETIESFAEALESFFKMA